MAIACHASENAQAVLSTILQGVVYRLVWATLKTDASSAILDL
jgi:hypothetical protein